MTAHDFNFGYFLENCNVEVVSTFFVCAIILFTFWICYGLVRLSVFCVRWLYSYYANKKVFNSEVKENEKA